MDRTGCATLTVNMSAFITPGSELLNDELHLNAKVEEDGTGKSYQCWTNFKKSNEILQLIISVMECFTLCNMQGFSPQVLHRHKGK